MPEISLVVKSPAVALPGVDDAIKRLERIDLLLGMLASRKALSIAIDVKGDENLQVAATNVATLAAALKDLGHIKVGENLAKGIVAPGEAAVHARREVERLTVEYHRLKDVAEGSLNSFIVKKPVFVTTGQMQAHDQHAQGLLRTMAQRDATLAQLQGMKRVSSMADMLAGGPPASEDLSKHAAQAEQAAAAERHLAVATAARAKAVAASYAAENAMNASAQKVFDMRSGKGGRVTKKGLAANEEAHGQATARYEAARAVTAAAYAAEKIAASQAALIRAPASALEVAPAIKATAAAEKELTPVAMAAAQALDRQMEIVLAKTRAMNSLTTATDRVAQADVDAAKAATLNAEANVRAGVLTEKVIKDKKGKVVDTVTKERTGAGRTLTTRTEGTETAFNTVEGFGNQFGRHDADFANKRAGLAKGGFLPGSAEQNALLLEDAAARGKIVEAMAAQSLGEEKLAAAHRVRAAADQAAAHSGDERLRRAGGRSAEKDQVAEIERNYEHARGQARTEAQQAQALRDRAAALRALQTQGGDAAHLRGVGVRAARDEAGGALAEEKGRLRTVNEQAAEATRRQAEAVRALNAALKDEVAIIERIFQAYRGGAAGGLQMAQALREKAKNLRGLAASPTVGSPDPNALRAIEVNAAKADATAERLERRDIGGKRGEQQQKLNASLREQDAIIERTYERARGLAHTEAQQAQALRDRAAALRALQTQGAAQGGDAAYLRGLGVRAARHEAGGALAEEKGRIRTVHEQEAEAARRQAEAERALNAALKDQIALIERRFQAERGAAVGPREMAQALRNKAAALRGLAASPGSPDALRAVGVNAAKADATAERMETRAAATGSVTDGGGASSMASGLLGKLGTAASWMGAYAVINSVTSALRAGFTAALDYQHQFARLQAVFRGTNEEALKLGNEVLKLAAENGRSGDEAVDAAIRWSRLGLSRVEAMEAVTVSLKTANVAEMTAADSAERLAAIYATYHLQVSDLHGVLNQLNTVSNTLNVTNKDLLNGIARTGAIAQQAGVGLSELIGLIGVGVARTGRPGAEIGNALKRTLSSFYKPELQDSLSKGFGFEVKTPLGDMKNASDLLGELYAKMQQISAGETGELLGKIGGAQQISRLQAVMDGYVQAQVKSIQAQRDLNSADRENALIRSTAQSQIASLTTEYTRLFSVLLNIGGESSAIRTLEKLAFSASKLLGDGADSLNDSDTGDGMSSHWWNFGFPTGDEIHNKWAKEENERIKARNARPENANKQEGLRPLKEGFVDDWYRRSGGIKKGARPPGETSAERELGNTRSLAGAEEALERLSKRLAETIGDTAAKNPEQARAALEAYGDVAGPETAERLQLLAAGNRIEEIRTVLLERGNKAHADRLALLERERGLTSGVIAKKEAQAADLRATIKAGGIVNGERVPGTKSEMEKQLAQLVEDIARLKNKSAQTQLGDLEEGDEFDPLSVVKTQYADGMKDRVDALRSLFGKGVGTSELDKTNRQQQALDAERAYVDRLKAGRELARPVIGNNQADAVGVGDVNAQEEWVDTSTAQQQINAALDEEVTKRGLALDVEQGKLDVLREIAQLQDAISGGVDSGENRAKNKLAAGDIGQNETERMLAQLEVARAGVAIAARDVHNGGPDNVPGLNNSVNTARSQGELIAYGNRLLEIRVGFAARQAALEADIVNAKERQNREASKALAMAGREDQLRAALLTKYAQENGPLSQERFQFLPTEDRQAADRFVPSARPARLGDPVADAQTELELNKGAIQGLKEAITPLLEVIRTMANPARLLQTEGPPPPPTLVLPNLTINLSDQAEQIARGFAALTEGRIAAEIGKMQLVIERFVGAQKFAAAQSAGAGSLS